MPNGLVVTLPTTMVPGTWIKVVSLVALLPGVGSLRGGGGCGDIGNQAIGAWRRHGDGIGQRRPSGDRAQVTGGQAIRIIETAAGRIEDDASRKRICNQHVLGVGRPIIGDGDGIAIARINKHRVGRVALGDGQISPEVLAYRFRRQARVCQDRR